MDKITLWESTLGELQLNLSTANFQTWFKGKTIIVSWENNLVELGCSSPYVKNWIESRYQVQIKAILDNVTGENNGLIFSVSSLVNNINRKPKNKQPSSNVGSPAPLFLEPDQDLFKEALSKANLNPVFNLENFVVGSSNQLAYAVAKSITDQGSKNYNPFFVYGGVGLGKTHLIQSIGQQLISKNPKLKVLYSPCEEFTNDLVTSIQTKTTREFKIKYRSLDVLLLDDAQFLSGREATQEEIFHTFNVLHSLGKQIIIASDRPPSSIRKLADRLRSRFEGGMVADIGKPDSELREAVLLKKCAAQKINLPSGLIRQLAECFPNSIRDLEGGLIRLITYSRVANRPPSPTLLKEVLDLTQKETARNTNPKKVVEIVARYFSTPVSEITGKHRQANLVLPRQIAMYILRNNFNISLTVIANIFNKADHTSVIYSVNKIKAQIKTSPKTRVEIGEISERIFT